MRAPPWPASGLGRALVALLFALFLILTNLVIAPEAAAATPAPNPSVPQQCGLSLTLVLDASGSINSSHAVEDVRDAGEAFLDALKNTGSSARVLQFATFGQQLASRQLVDTASLAQGGAFTDAIAGYYAPIPPRPSGATIHSYRGSGSISSAGSWSTNNSSNQYTNWQQAMNQAASDAGDLVVFVTDGDPTSYDFGQAGDPFPAPDVAVGTQTAPANEALARAVTAANGVKGTNARVLALGVGSALNNDASVDRLTQISGPNVTRTTGDFDINTTDVALITDFDQLANAVRTLILDLCSPSVTIRKFAQSADDGSYQPASGWDFTLTPTVRGGSFSWVLPTGATGSDATVITNSDGFAPFQWDTDPDTAQSDAHVEEDLQTGFIRGRPDADDWTCEIKDADGNTRTASGELSAGGPPSFDLSGIGQEIVTCSVYNSFDYEPDINVTKVNDPTVVRGDLTPPTPVTSTYEVTNPGNTPIGNITLVDDRCAPVEAVEQGGSNVGDSNRDNKLQTSETWQFTCERATVVSRAATGTTITNTVEATGTDPRGTLVTDTDTADVTAYVPAIELTKLVNGEPAVTVASGADVTYTYRATNAGNTALSPVELTDDTAPCQDPVRGPDDTGDDNDTMDVGETWTYSCESPGVTAAVLNTATVTGVPLNPSTGDPFTGRNPVVSDTDTAEVTVTDPDLTLIKTVDQDLVFPGTTVTYTYRATNDGDTDLRNDTGDPDWVTDNRCSDVTYTGGDDNDDDLLNPGETWEFECQSAITQQTVNVATIVAQPVVDGTPTGEPLTRRDVALVRVVEPAITVVKTALRPVVLDPDAVDDNRDDPAGGAFVGPDVPDPRPAQYLYDVSNTGDAPLADVTLTDDLCSSPAYQSGDTNGDEVLDVDEVWVYTCETTLEREQATPPPGDESGLVQNTATATGTPFLPDDPSETADPVSDTDIAQVLVIEPSLELIKSVSADVVEVNGEVTYTVEVRNTGDVGLELIGPLDDKCDLAYDSGDANDNDILDGADSGAPETWTFACTRAIGLPTDPDQTDVNTATVTGIDPLGNLYGDSDTAEVRVLDPDIDLRKTVSDDLVPAGSPVTYTYEVRNTGQSPVEADDVLDDVTLADVADPAQPGCRSPELVSKAGGNDNDRLERPTEVWTYSCGATIDEDTINVAGVVGIAGLQFDLRLPVFDIDAAFVKTFHPAIEITKEANPTRLLGGGDVTYTYAVHNTGDVPLADVADRISDDTCSPVSYVSGDTDDDGLLDTPTSIFEDSLDETWNFTCTTRVDETTTNVVTVTGTPTDPDGTDLCAAQDGVQAAAIAPCDVTASATAEVVVVDPGTIVITKQTDEATDTTFDFTLENQEFELGDGASETIDGLAPGDYTVREVETDGWELSSLSCDDPSEDTDTSTADREASITLAAGETVTCVFTNRATEPSPDHSRLPSTGSPVSLGLLVAALAMVIAGATLLVARRR